MLERFTARFALTDGTPGQPWEADGTVAGLLRRFGGCTFNGGLYRIHSPGSARLASEWVNAAYPEFQGKLVCFGFDWLGRQFALDPFRGSASDLEVLMLEPGTAEALEVPVPFSRFHDAGLEDYCDACLAPEFLAEWMATRQQPLRFTECAGYKVPLFLGGEDSTSNLEVSDTEVYWSLMGDLRVATRNLEPGTSILGADLSD
jgi:hypothetical protein